MYTHTTNSQKKELSHKKEYGLLPSHKKEVAIEITWMDLEGIILKSENNKYWIISLSGESKKQNK